MLSPDESGSIGPVQILLQALYFGLLVVISSLSGLTLLRWLNVCVPPRLALFLAPPVTLAAWSIMLGIGVGAGLPLKNFYLLSWAVTLALAAYACRRASLRAIHPDWWLVVIVLVAPIGAAEPYFRWGLTTFAGSPYLDGWSYAAFGQYIWEYPRQTAGGLAPLYQYAAHLSHARYIGSALLGFISPLVGSAGDPQPVMGIALAFALFAAACSVVVLAASYGLPTFGVLSVIVLSVFSGWSVGLISTNALDNCLALYSLPALVAIVRMADLRSYGWWLCIALFVSALLYTYPELAWIPVLALALVLIQRMSVLRIHLRAAVLPALTAALVAIALLAPFAATDLVDFFRSQVDSAFAVGAPRPGESLFHELTQPADLVWAFWGFDDQHLPSLRLSVILSEARVLLGCSLTLLGALGFGLLVRKREFATCAAIVILTAAAASLALRLGYGYGAFKILVMSWSLIVLCIVLGAATVVRVCQSVRFAPAGRTAILVVGGLFLIVVSVQVRAFGISVPTQSFETYKVVQQVASITRTEPVLVTVTNEFANSWAVYELRDSPIVLDSYTGYMSQTHVVPFMQQASVPASGPIRYVLADATPHFERTGFESVWAQGAYELWHANDTRWAFISRVNAPNGLEQWYGAPGFWLGTTSADIEITASDNGQACLTALLTPGLSLPDQDARRVDVSSGGGQHELLQFAYRHLEQVPVSVPTGVTHVVLTALDHPTLARLSSGDDRVLLVGVEDLNLALGPCQTM